MTSRSTLLAGMCAIAAIGAAPAAASAASSIVTYDPGTHWISVDGTDADNHYAVTVAGTSEDSATIAIGDQTDDVSVGAPAGPCVQAADHKHVTCTATAAAPIFGLDLGAAGGDDSVTVASPAETPAFVTVDGNDGDDTLSAGDGQVDFFGDAGDDTITGGAGDDYLTGGDGNDVIAGGAGEDTLDGSAGADDIHGGPGVDQVGYGDRTVPLDVSLDDVANDGAAGEGDNVHTDVENVYGGSGDDRISGDGAANTLGGYDGNDTLTGGGGPDLLYGQAGDDTLLSRDNTVDVDVCGLGADSVTGDAVDETSSCEAVAATPVTIPVQVVPAPRDTTPPTIGVQGLGSRVKRSTLLARGLRFSLIASEAVTYDVTLSGTARRARIARAGDLVLAARTMNTPGGATTLRLTMPRRLRKAIRRHATLRLTIVAVDAGGNRRELARKVAVR